MSGFLILGFLFGMSHALETDHLAAVGTLASSERGSGRRIALLGASWGFGHALTLLLIAAPLIALGTTMSPRVEAGMESLVGVMLCGLGLWVLWKIRRARVHFHVHDHGDGPHLHAHSHAGAHLPHDQDPHEHSHPAFSPRAFMVGLAHGAAGSGALVALIAATSLSPMTAIIYVVLFGLGAMCGMALLSWVVSWPLRVAEQMAGRALEMVRIAVAVLAIALGIHVVLTNAALLLA